MVDVLYLAFVDEQNGELKMETFEKAIYSLISGLIAVTIALLIASSI